MIAIAVTLLLNTETLDPGVHPIQRMLPQGLLLLGAMLAFLGTSAQALLIGMALMVLAALWQSAGNAPNPRVMQAFLPQCIGVLVSGLMLMLNASRSGSQLLDTITTDNPLTPLLTSVAVCLFARAPIVGALRDPASPQQHRAGVLCAFALLAHGPTLTLWSIALLLVGALVWSLLALSAESTERERTCLFYSSACLFLVSTIAGAPWVSAVMWLCAVHLLTAPFAFRLIALAIIAGFPLPGAISVWAGVANRIAAGGPIDAILNVVLIVAAGVHLASWLEAILPLSRWRETLAEGMRDAARHPAALAVAAHTLLFGFGVTLMGGAPITQSIRSAGAWGWIQLAATAAIGIALALVIRRYDVGEAFQGMGTAIARANVITQIFESMIVRVRNVFRTAFTLLESDGALLWACLVTIVAVLIARAGTP